MIFRFIKGDASALFDVTKGFLWKVDVAVQPCSYGSAAEGDFAQNFDGLFGALFGIGDLLRVTGEFLSEPDRGRIHQMGAAYFNNVPKFFCFCVERGVQLDRKSVV